MFDFKLIHVPAAQHKGPDALSRRPLAEGDAVEEEDEEDDWLDNIALYIGVTRAEAEEEFEALTPSTGMRDAEVLLTVSPTQDATLRKIFHFLETLEVPDFPTPSARYRFLKKCQNYFVRDGFMYRRYNQRMPVRVVFSAEDRQRILEEAHDQ